MNAPNKNNDFEVLSTGEIKRKYYDINEPLPAITLNPTNIPKELHALIPFAEKWGINDDVLRLAALQKATAAEIADLNKVVRSHDDMLDAWLAGPESQGPDYSAEYLAFSNMRMASDGF